MLSKGIQIKTQAIPVYRWVVTAQITKTAYSVLQEDGTIGALIKGENIFI